MSASASGRAGAGEGSSMEMPKPTEADRTAFRKLVADEPDVDVKPMFGNLSAFVNGNMFMGLFGSDIGVKLRDPDGRPESMHHG